MIVEGSAPKEEIVDMLRDMNERGIDADDLQNLAAAFRRATLPATTRFPVVADLCGTGGGTVRTFNISTIASLVVAGAGVPVAKHGNRSNAGRCGSADLIEALGADLRLSPSECGDILDAVGFGFFFAQKCNPAMRNAAEARKEVGGSTVFNVLGPLLNPVLARRRQLIGVYDRSLLDPIAKALDAVGVEGAMLVHGNPGMDEVNILGQTEAVLVEEGALDRFVIDPSDLGFNLGAARALADRPPAESAELALSILSGDERSTPRDAVVLNAGCGLRAFRRSGSIEEGIRLAEHSIDSGSALRKLRDFLAANERVASQREG